MTWREWLDSMTPDELRAYWRESYRRRTVRRHAQGLTSAGRNRNPVKRRTDKERLAAAAKKREYNKLYQRENRARINIRTREYRNRPEVRAAIRIRDRNYLEQNRKEIYAARRLHEVRNPIVRIKHNLRCRLRDAIRRVHGRGYVASAVRDLGCSVEAFKGYMQLQFSPGMGWENWGEWHIDHRKPLCDFDLTAREQVLEACHYTNLQPLWAKDNLTKNRWHHPPAYSHGGG